MKIYFRHIFLLIPLFLLTLNPMGDKSKDKTYINLNNNLFDPYVLKIPENNKNNPVKLKIR